MLQSFDLASDKQMREAMKKEKSTLVNMMLKDKNKGLKTQPVKKKEKVISSLFHHFSRPHSAKKNVLRKNSVTLDEDETNMTLFLFFSGAKKKEIRLEFLFHPLYLTS